MTDGGREHATVAQTGNLVLEVPATHVAHFAESSEISAPTLSTPTPSIREAMSARLFLARDLHFRLVSGNPTR